MIKRNVIGLNQSFESVPRDRMDVPTLPIAIVLRKLVGVESGF